MTYVLPPHVLEPQFPGAYESLFSLNDCWDEDRLYKNRTAIMSLSEQCGKLHKTASSYLYAAGALLIQLQTIADDATDRHKVVRLATSIAAREFPRRKAEGQEQIRFVSGITNQGIVTFEDTITAVAPRLYIIEDSWGAASSLLLATLRRLALESGQNIVTCSCPIFPFTKIDHLLLPELGLGFITRNRLNHITLTGERTIHARRFTDAEKLKAKKHRMSFLLRAASNMLEQAILQIKEAKHQHDLLEAYYIDAMQFDKVNQKTSLLIERFCSLANG